jgi:type IV fimbrial biogenesis protein FimT
MALMALPPAEPPRPPGNSGLTLLELVICVAVLAVLGVMALPGVGAQMDRQRLRHAARSLAADITEARFLAAQHGQPVYVQVRDGSPWCWSVALESGCDCSSPGTCGVHRVGSGDHAGVQLIGALDLRVESTGAVAAAAATTLVSARGERLRVEVLLQGRARICAPGGGDPQWPAC